jgi:tRNA1(Val) A37 N6-methylase TrmN6
MPDEGVAEDALLGGRVRLLQPRRGHRAGTDAVLLAALASPAPGATVVDVGAGSGAVGLMVAARVADLRLVLVEREPDLAELCRRNLALNGLVGEVIEADILERGTRQVRTLAPEGADAVLTNPPFLEEGQSRLSPDAARARAHALPGDGLAAWIEGCTRLLKPGGTFALIHRADRLAECLSHAGAKLGALTLRFVHPRAEAPAARLLLTGVKGSRAPLTVAPPLVLHDDDGRFTPAAEALHRGDAALT